MTDVNKERVCLRQTYSTKTKSDTSDPTDPKFFVSRYFRFEVSREQGRGRTTRWTRTERHRYFLYFLLTGLYVRIKFVDKRLTDDCRVTDFVRYVGVLFVPCPFARDGKHP